MGSSELERGCLGGMTHFDRLYNGEIDYANYKTKNSLKITEAIERLRKLALRRAPHHANMALNKISDSKKG